MPLLPHIYPLGAMFFITFRLENSLPQKTVHQLRQEYNIEMHNIRKQFTDLKIQESLIYKMKKKLFGKFDKQLDELPYGACHMKDSNVAQIIYDKILQYDNEYYRVHALSIMPNHVHMLLDTSIQLPNNLNIEAPPENYVDVPKWLQLIKGGSAFLINKHLVRSGTLWAKESYDHYVRFNKEGEYQRIKDYIINNPKKARLNKKYMELPYLVSS